MITPDKHQTQALPGPDDIVRHRLPNGITVLARENFTSPSVVVEGAVFGGAIQEPPGKAGLANFHASLLMRGTAHRTFDRLYEDIESNGADMSFSAGGHTLRFSSKSLAEDLPLMLGLASEVLQEPAFPPEHVERVRGQIVTGLQMRAHNTRAMAALKFQELVYPPDHPYGTSISGYLETVPGITREDVVSFHHNFGPRDAVIVVVGAVSAEEAIRRVEESFGSWQNPDQPDKPQAPAAPRLPEARRASVAIPGKSQTNVALGYPGPSRAEPDYHAARMANSILGVFGLYGRLGDTVREQQGLAYYCYSHLRGGFGPGPWTVSAGVAPENVERAVESILHEVRRMVDEPVSEEELAENKTFFKGSLVLGLETNEGVSGVLQTIELHDLGLDYLLHYNEMIDALTVENVQAAARHYLDPDAYALAVAGPALP